MNRLLAVLIVMSVVVGGAQAQISAPIAIASNLANQTEFFDQEPSMVGATLLTATSTHEAWPVACEMTDEEGNILGVAPTPVGICGGTDLTTYQVIIAVHPLYGSWTFDYVLDESPPEVPCIEEESDACGIISISYRGLPRGPTLGERYDYRLLVRVIEQIAAGDSQWRLERYADWSASLITVGPPHTPNPSLDRANPSFDGPGRRLANFDFVSPTGANQAIIQVACDSTFTPDATYAHTIPGDWTGTELPALNSTQVDLSQVPSAGDVYYWRIGARNTDNLVAPRPYPLSLSSNHGYVWSERMYFVHLGGRFTDVPLDHWAYDEIEACTSMGIVSGYPDGTYQPDVAVSRDQMAVYIARALAGSDEGVPAGPPTPSFPDVAPDDVCYRYIEHAVANEVVFGYPDGLYHPEHEVDRGQMAIFIARATATPTGEPGMVTYIPPARPTFADVTPYPLDPYQACYKYVECLAAAGVTQGYPDGLYHPEYIVSRGLMAIYVARAFQLLP